MLSPSCLLTLDWRWIRGQVERCQSTCLKMEICAGNTREAEGCLSPCSRFSRLCLPLRFLVPVLRGTSDHTQTTLSLSSNIHRVFPLPLLFLAEVGSLVTRVESPVGKKCGV
jgi:hypothetical protein